MTQNIQNPSMNGVIDYTQFYPIRENLHSKGYFIHPIKHGEKRPLTSGWQTIQCKSELLKQPLMVGLGMGHQNLWALDVDSKNWPNGTKDLNNQILEFVKSQFSLTSFVYQYSQSGGLHIIFKIEDADWSKLGNAKFAKTASGDDLLESRGKGGQIVIYDESGVWSQLDRLESIGMADLSKLISFAQTFHFEQPKSNLNSHDNSRWIDKGENRWIALEYLKSFGWEVVKEESDKFLVKRPNSTNPHSGTCWKETGAIWLWSSGTTGLDEQRSYSPWDIYQMNKPIETEPTERKQSLSKKPTRVLRAFSPSEFMEVEMNKPPLELIGDCIPMSGLTVLYGLTKTGKSILAYQMMNDLARGNDLFGGFLRNEFGPKKVVYYDNENPRGVISKRYSNEGDLSTFYFKDVEHNVSLVLDCIEDMIEPPEKFPSSDELLDQAIEIVTEKINEGFEVIIVDNMMRLVTGNNKESDVMSKIMYKFKSLSETYRVAVILVTHTNKEYKTTRLTPYHISGSAMTANLASTFIALNRNEFETKYWLTIPAGRFGTPLGDGQCIPYEMEADSNFIGLRFKELDFESSMVMDEETELVNSMMSTSIKDFDMKRRCWEIFYQEQNMNASQTAIQLHAEFPNRRKKPLNHKTVNAWAHDMNAWMKERDGIPNSDNGLKPQDSNNSHNSQIDLLADPNLVF